MAEPDRPQSPFAGMADLAPRTPIRVLSPVEIEQMMAEHRLYLETEYHQGHRANFSSADLAGRDFSGLNLRGIKMDRALLSAADFTGAHLQSANLTGAIAERADFDRADLSRARLSGANLVSASLEDACLAKAEMEFALMANVTRVAPAPRQPGLCLPPDAPTAWSSTGGGGSRPSCRITVTSMASDSPDDTCRQ